MHSWSSVQLYWRAAAHAASHMHAVAVGELEKAATPPPPPPPTPTPPADFSWGGTRSGQPATGLTSLRKIQSQEAAITQRPGVHAHDLLLQA